MDLSRASMTACRRARGGQTWRGRRPLAGTDTRGAEPGRPCLGPGEPWPGPHGARQGDDREAQVQGVGPPHRTAEVCEPGSPEGTGGAGGGQEAGGGERGGASQEPDAVPGSPGTGAGPRTAGNALLLTSRLHVSTRGRSPVRSCRTLGSVWGVPGNWHPYHDERECKPAVPCSHISVHAAALQRVAW